MLSLRGLPLELRDVFMRGPVLCWSRLGREVQGDGKAAQAFDAAARTALGHPRRRLAFDARPLEVREHV